MLTDTAAAPALAGQTLSTRCGSGSRVLPAPAGRDRSAAGGPRPLPESASAGTPGACTAWRTPDEGLVAAVQPGCPQLAPAEEIIPVHRRTPSPRWAAPDSQGSVGRGRRVAWYAVARMRPGFDASDRVPDPGASPCWRWAARCDGHRIAVPATAKPAHGRGGAMAGFPAGAPDAACKSAVSVDRRTGLRRCAPQGVW